MTTRQVWRPLAVTVSAVVMVIGTLAGFGLLGTRVEESSGGAFAADATLLTPATPAFSVWSLIYIGLLGYVIWQWRTLDSPRAARIAWPAAASMLLNALWLGVTQLGWLWPSVVVILVLAVVLGVLVRRLGETPPRSRIEAVVVDGTFGVYLGWVSVASVANITAVLVDAGVDPGAPWAEVLAAVVLVVAALLGVGYAVRLGGRWAIAAAMVWALAWIAVGRLAGPLYSTPTAIAAALAAVAILAATAILRRGDHAATSERLGAGHG
ncbi:MAG: tryptophan-rich sensory protein [Actinobacteria bacterium]|nr:tryptophan-rich sensory protein [Actinomycetota bacterium]